MRTTILLACIALAGCNGPRHTANDNDSMDAFWLGLAGIIAGMLATPAPRSPTFHTDCSTFGQMGHGFSFTSY